MSPKDPCLQTSVLCLATHTSAPVSRGVGVDEFAPPVHALLRWVDKWFLATSKERMGNVSMAYWS